MVGQGFDQPSLEKGVTAHGRASRQGDVEGFFQPKPSYNSMSQETLSVKARAWTPTSFDRL